MTATATRRQPSNMITMRRLLEAVEADQVTWHPNPDRPQTSFSRWYLGPDAPSPRHRVVTFRARQAVDDGLIRVGPGPRPGQPDDGVRRYKLTAAGVTRLLVIRNKETQP